VLTWILYIIHDAPDLLLSNARQVDYDFTKFTIQPTPLFVVFVVAHGGEMLRIKPILLHARILNGIGCTQVLSMAEHKVHGIK